MLDKPDQALLVGLAAGEDRTDDLHVTDEGIRLAGHCRARCRLQKRPVRQQPCAHAVGGEADSDHVGDQGFIAVWPCKQQLQRYRGASR